MYYLIILVDKINFSISKYLFLIFSVYFLFISLSLLVSLIDYNVLRIFLKIGFYILEISLKILIIFFNIAYSY